MHLHTLGGLKLEDTDFSRPKPLLLLAYLAMEGPQDRRHMAELFWQGAKDPMSSLRVALARLRKAVPDAVRDDDHRIATDLYCDASALLETVEEGRNEELLTHYEGSFVDGFYLKNIPSELEEWIYGTREFLGQRVRGALLTFAEALATQSETVRAARIAEQALDLAGAGPAEPEQLQRAYRLLQAGTRPRADEIAAELIDYGIELPTEVPVQARPNGDARRNAPNNLTIPITSFVGRQRELEDLAELLTSGQDRLITLLGTAGVGKTRLSIHSAHRALKRNLYPEGVYWVGLDAITDIEQIAEQIAQGVGLALQGNDPVIEQLIRYVSDRRLLLVLDNYEQLIEGAMIPVELITACPQLTILVTSRERLSVSEERVIPVDGLAYPTDPAIANEDAASYDAVRLFVLRAQRSDAHFRLDSTTLPGVLHLCRLVEGAPLGLELAAAWARALSVDDIATELERGLDSLEARSRNVPEKHRSLKAAFERSWELLSQQERDALKRLSVFRGGFRREAASEVVGATLPLLANLVDKSLLRLAPNGRYDRHPLLYQFSLEKLAEDPDELADYRIRHGAYFRHHTPTLMYTYFGELTDSTRDQMREEFPNMHAAWATYLDTLDTASIADVAWVHGNTSEIFGMFREARAALEPALDILDDSTPSMQLARGKVLGPLSVVYWRLGLLDQGAQYGEEGARLLATMEPPGERLGTWWALQGAGLNYFFLGRLTEAIATVERAREVADVDARAGPDPALKAYLDGLAGLSATLLASTTATLGDLEQAGLYAAEAHVRQYRSTPRFAAYANDALTLVALAKGSYDEAAHWAEEGIAHAVRVRHETQILPLQTRLGQALYPLGRYDEALRVLSEAIERADLGGDLTYGTQARAMLGRTLVKLGRPTDALPVLLRALADAQAIGAVPYALDDTLMGLVECAQAQQRLGLAAGIARLLTTLEHARPLIRELAGAMLEQLPDPDPDSVMDPHAFTDDIVRAFR